MTTRADLFSEWRDLRERQLQAVIDEYRAMSALLEQQRAELIDICLQFGDHATVDAILAHLQRTTATWQNWPRERASLNHKGGI